MEKIKDIPWYEWMYWVTESGRIWSYPKKFKQYARKWKFISFKNTDWYLAVYLYKFWKRKRARIHRLVALTYLPNPQNKPFINHKNGIRHDNRLENLEWCTPEENLIHAIDILQTIPKRKKVMQLTKEWILCKVYESCYEASRITWFAHGNIFNTALGKFKHCGWYLWKFI